MSNMKPIEKYQQKFIDLGLPSGTLWADANEEGYFSFDEAKKKFGDSVPSIELWDELREECDWKWDKEKNGYTVTGPNGNSIFLPAAGYRYDSFLGPASSGGYYWSSSLGAGTSRNVGGVYFDSGYVGRDYEDRYDGHSVRLVKISNKICNSMRKIPFEMKYRPEIESGKYKVVTADGRPVRIICWDKAEYGGNKTLIALIPASTGTECIYQYYPNGIPISSVTLDKWRLQIETDEPKWTEFEKEFDNAIRSYRSEDFEGDYIQWVRMRAKKLLEIAKAQK